MKALREYGMLGVFLLACLGLGGSGALFPPGEWYRLLAKPPLTPPDGIFGPVWTLLYVLMAVAAWLVWRNPRTPARRAALALFSAQLMLNAAWSWIFFGWRQVGLALADLFLLWAMILFTLLAFRRIRREAALLLLPYLLWVSFAAYLNAGIWWLNRP